MNIEHLKKQIMEALATAQGVRSSAENRPHWQEDDAIEAQDNRKEMKDDGETVRVSKGRGPAKVTRKVSDRVRDRRAAEGKPHGSRENPVFRTRVIKPEEEEPGKKRQVASTEIVRAARVALAEAVRREMEITRMKPLEDKRSRKSGGRGYAQLDTIERMKAQHQSAMRRLRQNNSGANKRKQP